MDPKELTKILTVILFFYISTICTQECSYTHLPNNTLFANCSRQGFNNIPCDIDQNTTNLDLSHNVIYEILEEECKLRELKLLVKLDLSYNKLSNITSMFFYHFASNLIYLDLSYNRLANQLPNDTFKGCTSLQELRIQGNQFTNYSDNALESCTNLKILVADGLMNQTFGKGFLNLKNLTIVILSGSLTQHNCKINRLFNGTFSNVPYLKYLNISYCEIKYVEPGALEPLHDLFLLNASFNYPNGLKLLRNITYGLKNTTTEVLVLDKLELPFGKLFPLDISDMEFLKHGKIKILSLRGNRIQYFQFGALERMPTDLKVLYMNENLFSFDVYLLELMHMRKLKYLYVDYINTYRGDMDMNDRKYDWDIYEHIKKLEVGNLYLEHESVLDSYLKPDHNSFKQSKDSRVINQVFGDKENDEENKALQKMVKCLPQNLTKLYMRSANIELEIPHLKLAKNTPITFLNFSRNIFFSWKGPLENVENVQVLDFSANYCYKVSKVFFSKLNKLEWLRIPQNFLGFDLKDDVDGEIFGQLKNLKILNLHSNRITTLPKSCFKGLESLEHLDLSENSLTQWDLEVKHMPNISYINLENNNLGELPTEVIRHFTEISKTHNVTINMKNNPLECVCNNIEFIKWILGASIQFEDLKNYTCRNENWQVLALQSIDLPNFEKQCTKLTGVIIACASLLGLFFIIIIAVILYRKRWKLRYVYYMTIGRYSLMHEEHDHRYKYDAFVSYADEDLDFVNKKLLPELEMRHGLTLCLHHRDFIPGHAIAANIVDAIQNSRRTVVILSQAFVDSYWCMFEFNMARMESMFTRGDKQVLFLVILDNVTSRDLPLEVLEVIQNDSYIEYPNDEQGDIVFWQRLQQAIQC